MMIYTIKGRYTEAQKDIVREHNEDERVILKGEEALKETEDSFLREYIKIKKLKAFRS